MTDEFKNCDLCLCPLEVRVGERTMAFTAHTAVFCADLTRNHIAILRSQAKQHAVEYELVKRQLVDALRMLDRARDQLSELRGDRCPNCGAGPLHASESDDLGRCAKCAADADVKERVDAAEVAFARRALAEADAIPPVSWEEK